MEYNKCEAIFQTSGLKSYTNSASLDMAVDQTHPVQKVTTC